MRFQILHRSPGRIRLRACVKNMEARQADLLEAWLLAQPEVERVVVQETICSVTVVYHGALTPVTDRLAAFSTQAAAEALPPLHRSSRAMNRAYQEKLVFMVLRHYLKKRFLPTQLRIAIGVCQSAPRIYMLKIDGMQCAMCEAHIKEVIRRELPFAKKVTASHVKGNASFLSEENVNEEQLKKAIASTGYSCIGISSELHKKRGWFWRK